MRLGRWKKYAIGAGGMLVLVVALLLVTGWGTAVAAQISSVFVANTSSNPIPVQAVGTLPVHEQGAANVNVQNLPATQQTRDVLSAGQDPVTFGTSSAVSGIPQAMTPTVPSGKRLIVTWVAVSVFGTTLNEAECDLNLNPALNENDTLGRLQGAFGTISFVHEWSGSEQLSVVLGAGDQMEAACSTASGAGGTTPIVSTTVSGYFVPSS